MRLFNYFILSTLTAFSNISCERLESVQVYDLKKVFEKVAGHSEYANHKATKVFVPDDSRDVGDWVAHLQNTLGSCDFKKCYLGMVSKNQELLKDILINVCSEFKLKPKNPYLIIYFGVKEMKNVVEKSSDGCAVAVKYIEIKSYIGN